MHEFGIAEGALKMVLERQRAAGAARVHAVTLRIGALAGVVPEALEFAFDALKEGTPAAEARLTIEHLPLICYCAACNKEFTARASSYRCPDCGQASRDIRQGRELDLAAIEVS